MYYVIFKTSPVSYLSHTCYYKHALTTVWAACGKDIHPSDANDAGEVGFGLVSTSASSYIHTCFYCPCVSVYACVCVTWAAISENYGHRLKLTMETSFVSCAFDSVRSPAITLPTELELPISKLLNVRVLIKNIKYFTSFRLHIPTI